MSIKYAQFEVSVHGIDADAKGVETLALEIKEAVRKVLLGNQRDQFKFRDEFDSDLEAELVETAGEG